MKFEPDKKQITWGLTIFLTFLACILAFFLLLRGGEILSFLHRILNSMRPITYGIIIAIVMSPVMAFLENKLFIPWYKSRGISFENRANFKKFRHMRTVSVALTMSFLILIVYGFLAIVLPQLFQSIRDIILNLPVYVQNANDWIDQFLSNNPELASNVNYILDQLSDRFSDYMQNTVMPNLAGIISTLSLRIVDLLKECLSWFIGLIVAFYLLAAKETFAGQGKKIAYACLNENLANEIISGFRYVYQTFIGFIFGKLVDSLIIGVMSYIGCKILAIPYPVLVSVIVGVTNIIPFFGPYIGEVIGTLLLVLVHPVSALVFLIFIVILQQFDGNILGPKILGNTTGLSSFWVIFSIMLFGALWGAVGWVIGVPVFAVIYAFGKRLTSRLLRGKNMSTKTSRYIQTAYVEHGVYHPLGAADSTKYNSSKGQSTWKKLFARSPHLRAEQDAETIDSGDVKIDTDSKQ